jgi:hypothetical protein
MLPLDAVIGELYIVNGQRQSAASFSGAFTAPRRATRGRQGDTLFILADASGQTPLISEVIERIQQTYWHTPGSVTAGLRAAIEAGNDWLVDSNRSALAATRAGVTCAVLRGSEIFIAQAGPSYAYVAHQGRLERFPSGASGDAARVNLPPLGVARAVELRFSRADLHPGDTLLLADASLATHTPEEAIASAIVYVGVETALNNLEQLIGSDNLVAMVVEVTAPTQAQALAAAPVETAAQPRAQDRSVAPSPAPKVGEWAGAIGQGVSRGAGTLGAAARALFRRTLPDRPAAARPSRRRSTPSIERHAWLMGSIAVGIPLIVAAIVTAVYVERSTAARIDTLLTQGQALMAEAGASSSVEARGERWLAALTKANEALALAPEDAAAIDLRTQAQAQLDRLDGTQRVSPVLLYDFMKVGQHRLATQGLSLFVMDQREGRVDRLALNNRGDGVVGDEPVLAVAKGDTVGDRVVGNLIDMIWVEAGGERQKSALIVLERGGLVEYDLAFGPGVVRFAESSVPVGARRLDTFDGNLYLLDVTARQIWKYLPGADGYTALPETYFETPPAGIENTIDLAIDGSVYTLEANGAAHKYFGGSEVPFSLTGPPSPIGKPVAAAVDPNTPTDSGFYVADAGDARILHFAPDGRFIRQIRASGDEFAAIEDLLVDERLGRLYVISGGRLYSAALPPATATP